MYSIKIENGQIVSVVAGAVLEGHTEITDSEYQQYQESKIGCTYEIIKGKLVITPPDPKILAAQAEQKAVDAVKHALQAHIDNIAKGLGFSDGNAVMLYAGFANAFQSLAQAFGAWEAGIWVAANEYMAQVKAGEAPMLTPEQVVERIPAFDFKGA